MTFLRTLTATGWAIVAVAVVILVGIGVFVLTEPGRQKAKASEATGTAIVATASQAATVDAMNASETASEAARASEALTGANHAEILSTPGADASVGAVSGAGLRALCLRNAYHDDPRCRAMRASGS